MTPPSHRAAFSPSSLLANVQAHWPAQAKGLCVAFSGGLDSTVLLAALAACTDPIVRPLRAVHIDHGLQAQSQHWARQGGEVARSLGIPFLTQSVRVELQADEGPEAAARRARYAALAALLEPGEVLVTAHHADDQLETLLLAMLRGAGLRGLSSMPLCQHFGSGWHMRPLLTFTRQDLEAWATRQSLRWIADPSNETDHFSRNFLRREVIPRLRERWPAAADAASRSASHAAEGADLLDELAQIDLAHAAVGDCLSVPVLAHLSSARRRNLMRYWLRMRGARAPSLRKLLAIEHDMLLAQEDRQPVIAWDGFEVRRFRGLLYAGEALNVPRPAHSLPWNWQESLQLPAQLGSLRTQLARGRGLRRTDLPPILRVDFRHCEEESQSIGPAQHRKLKKLQQEAGVLPWWRGAVPRMWIDDRLVAVGDFWTDDAFAARPDEESVQIIWQGRPRILAQSPP